MDNKKPTINFEKGITTFIFWICSGLMFGYLDYHIQKWFANTNKIQ